MSKEIEIEFKNLLTEEEYAQLMNYFGATEEMCWLQENHYYDTPDYQLKAQHSALRIRVLPETAEMTLKTPYESFLLESTELISIDEASKMITSGTLVPQKDVAEKLNELGVHAKELRLQMTLATFRYEKEWKDVLVVLDKSTYNGQVDYELEIESADETTGKTILRNLLDTFDIPERKTPNKIQRAYNSAQN